MIRRLGGWLTVRATVWGLNRGIPPDQMLDYLRRAYPMHDGPWRWRVLAAAEAKRKVS